MKHQTMIALGALALMSCTATAQDRTITTPEGAQIDVADDLAYAEGSLTEDQLTASTRELFVQQSMNVFRRFPREDTEAMVRFYTEALALRALNPIQLTSTQQMILTGVGSGQIKLSAGQPENRSYALEGGPTGGTGIRYFMLTYPDADTVAQRFAEAGFAAPEFSEASDGSMQAMVDDPGGFPVQIVIRESAQDHSDDGVGVGIGVSDLAASRAYYREFVGLDELASETDPVLGITRYPYRHGETTLYLYEVGTGLPADTGSAGIQYVVNDAAMVDARAAHREIAVQTPLNRLAGFELVTVWLYDPDGVTNYFAQVGANP